MDKEQLRKVAVERYLAKEHPIDICRDLGCDKKWLYKWVHRYESGHPDWYKEQSEAPKSIPNKIHPDIENRIIEIRSQLENQKYLQFGASAIVYEFVRLGQSPTSVWLINPVLKRNNLIKKLSRDRYQSKELEYPYFTEPHHLNKIHQTDYVGPRYIKNDGRFYSLNVMDYFTHSAYTCPGRTKEDKSTRDTLVASWKYLGMPDYLQIDR